MDVRKRLLAAAIALCALICVLPAHALASATQDSILMDDDQLIYSSPDHVARALAQIASLGVDRVKVSVVWSLIAPRATSSKRPKFTATDPHAYPNGAWDRYDTVVRLAHQLGMNVYFQLAPFSPKWATTRYRKSKQGPPLGRAPNPKEFRQFVEAVARRYSGSYVAVVPANEPQLTLLGIPISGQQSGPRPGQANPIPRVDYWGIWNEPNERSWLNPWWRWLKGHKKKALIQPPLYRGLVDAAWGALQATGHGGDTILLGETANKGILAPVVFIRGLYCISSSDRPLRGQAAAQFLCPSSGNRAAFVRAHPGLFQSTGFAHHPYVFDAAPNTRISDPNVVTLNNATRFEHIMQGIFAAYGRHPASGIPLYMTEWGYKTRPPNPYVKTTLAQQAAWLNQGDYMTWGNPYVRALAQFELVDSRPKQGARPGSALYWSTFQTGLEYRNGTPKPSFDAFRIPIWLPTARHGSQVTVWGQLRAAFHGAVQTGVIWYSPRNGAWTQIRVIQTSSPRGFLVAHVPIPGPGSVRLSWRNSHGVVYYSRTVAVS